MALLEKTILLLQNLPRLREEGPLHAVVVVVLALALWSAAQ
jgi:hypothetical protein